MKRSLFLGSVLTAIGAAIAVGACQTAEKKVLSARAVASEPEALGRLQVSMRSTSGVFTMTRLDLVGTSIVFDLTMSRNGRIATHRYALPLGGSNNAYDATMAAVSGSLFEFAKTFTGDTHTLWASTDADQWWSSPDAAPMLRSIATGPATRL
jgi:hypothetical protein